MSYGVSAYQSRSTRKKSGGATGRSGLKLNGYGASRRRLPYSAERLRDGARRRAAPHIRRPGEGRGGAGLLGLLEGGEWARHARSLAGMLECRELAGVNRPVQKKTNSGWNTNNN